LRHRRMRVEDLLERTEWEEQDQTKAGDESR
jgi:hypothetical protein